MRLTAEQSHARWRLVGDPVQGSASDEARAFAKKANQTIAQAASIGMDDCHLVDGVGNVAGFLSELPRCRGDWRFAGIHVAIRTTLKALARIIKMLPMHAAILRWLAA